MHKTKVFILAYALYLDETTVKNTFKIPAFSPAIAPRVCPISQNSHSAIIVNTFVHHYGKPLVLLPINKSRKYWTSMVAKVLSDKPSIDNSSDIICYVVKN